MTMLLVDQSCAQTDFEFNLHEELSRYYVIDLTQYLKYAVGRDQAHASALVPITASRQTDEIHRFTLYKYII